MLLNRHGVRGLLFLVRAKIQKTEVGDEDLAGLLEIVVGGGGQCAKVSGLT